MGDDEEEKVGSEIELARKELEANIEKREKEAKEKLDEILSEEKMVFCSRCGRKVASRLDWAGKCLWTGCDKLLCRDCWDVEHYRFCSAHSRQVHGKPESEAKEREFFRPEGGGPVMDKEISLEDEQGRLDKLRYYASEYARWLEKRFGEKGVVDWTPTEHIAGARFERAKDDEDYVIRVWVKRWFRKQVKLSVIVTAFDAKQELDAGSLNAELRKLSRNHKGYGLIVLVADGAKMDAVNFVNGFTDTALSLFMVEPKKGNLYFNIKDRVTTAYSDWFSQKKEPLAFRERLKRLAEIASGRSIVSQEAVAKEFGFRDKDAGHILRSCSFLANVHGTDTYILDEGV
jgi:hypothetical protein